MLALFSNNNFNIIARKEMKKIITPDSKVLCFSGSDYEWQIDNTEELSQGGRYYKEQYEPFKDLNVTENYFYIVKPQDDKNTIKSRLHNCDIIFLAGGHMSVLEYILKQFEVWNLLKIYDKHIIGVSAGALIQLDQYDITPYIDKDYDYYETCNGLGLVKNLRLIVHYHDDYDKHHEVFQHIADEIVEEMSISNKDIMLVALSDSEGMLVNDNSIKFVGE